MGDTEKNLVVPTAGSLFNPSNYSANYQEQIVALTTWFAQRLPALGAFTLTQEQYKDGVDSLQGYHAQLVQAAFIEWLTMSRYELSYNQTSIAFFSAANSSGLLTVEG